VATLRASNSYERGGSWARVVTCGTIVCPESNPSAAGLIAEAIWGLTWGFCCASGTLPALGLMKWPRVTEVLWRRRECALTFEELRNQQRL
jgi:hypothetical protein